MSPSIEQNVGQLPSVEPNVGQPPSVAHSPIAIVAGSGLDLAPLLDRIERETPFDQIPGLVHSTLHGHDRRFLFGEIKGRPIILQCGRLHLYEGLSFEDVVRPVDVLHQWGARSIVFTNVVGGLRPEMRPSDTVAITRLCTWPFVHWPNQPEVIETDWLLPGCDYEGEYRWVHGPNYETPAEIRALQRLNGAVVGMSTAPETVRCRQLGIRFAVVSCVTNNCAAPEPLTHEAVVAAAQQASTRVAAILQTGLSLRNAL